MFLSFSACVGVRSINAIRATLSVWEGYQSTYKGIGVCGAFVGA